MHLHSMHIRQATAKCMKIKIFRVFNTYVSNIILELRNHCRSFRLLEELLYTEFKTCTFIFIKITLISFNSSTILPNYQNNTVVFSLFFIQNSFIKLTL